MNSLLSTAYLAPVGYFALIAQSQEILLERFENYPKQTYRNRCTIYGANGPLSLTVPVTKGNLIKIYSKDIRIDYSSNWLKIHSKAIESAYNNSPFYQFYIDEFMDVYKKQPEFLFDFNLELLQLICDVTRINSKISGTEIFNANAPEGFTDYRHITNTKTNSQTKLDFQFPHYTQVFESKFGFIENLSILDLLFNVGPDSGNYLAHITIKKD